MQYATVAAWNQDPRTTSVVAGSPDEAALIGRLEVASQLVDEMAITAVYPTDASGYPTGAAVAAALSRACIEQALFTDETDPDGSGIVYGAMSLGSLQLPAGGSSGSGGTASGPYSPIAWRVLRAAGLITGRVA